MNGAHSRVDLVPGQGGAGPAQQPGGAVAVGQTRIEPGAHVLGAQDHRLTMVQPGQIGAGGAGHNGAGQQPLPVPGQPRPVDRKSTV